MRIIAGEFRGRPLKSLKGDATRPTTDRVREALMSSLVSARGTLEGAWVLDAFAGSCVLGLETLSRGAAHVMFCEQGKEVARVVEGNISSLKLSRGRYTLRRGDTFTLPQVKGLAFDLVFLILLTHSKPKKYLAWYVILIRLVVLPVALWLFMSMPKKTKPLLSRHAMR